jgi:hypothetical protein
MSAGKGYIHEYIIGVLIVLSLSVLALPIVYADSDVPSLSLYPQLTHRQIPVFQGQDNTSQANTGDSTSSKILDLMPKLVPVPLSTPAGNEEASKFHISYTVPYFSVPSLVIPVRYDTLVCGDSCLFNFIPSSIQTGPINVTEQWELVNNNQEITWFNPAFNHKTGSIVLVPPPVPTISACGNCGGNLGFPHISLPAANFSANSFFTRQAA